MLVNLCDYKQSVTLIANSGVQFLDFGLTPQESAAPWPLCAQNGKRSPATAGFRSGNGSLYLAAALAVSPKWVKPESTQTLHYSLDVLDGVWLPLPFLRFNPPRTFVEGPDNWARVQVRKLAQPDSAGNTTALPWRWIASSLKMPCSVNA